MRWPFGPPHLTLKPSTKTKNKKQNTKKNKNKKKQPTPPPPPPQKKTKKKRRNKEPKKRKTAKIPKKSFSVISHFFPFLVGVHNFLFLTPWPKKHTPKQHYKNRGFSKFFLEKQMCVTKRPFFGQKTQIQKFQLSFLFLPFSSLSTTKNTNIC